MRSLIHGNYFEGSKLLVYQEYDGVDETMWTRWEKSLKTWNGSILRRQFSLTREADLEIGNAFEIGDVFVGYKGTAIAVSFNEFLIGFIGTGPLLLNGKEIE